MVNIKTIIKQKELDYSGIMSTIASLKDEYYFLKCTELGKSVLGRSIPMLQIGVSDDIILFTGAFHGMERITTLLLLLFTEQFCSALKNDTLFSGASARNSLFGKSIVIVPAVNPDGYEIALKGAAGAGAAAGRVKEICNDDFSQWNANARGVDLNHNFDAGFSILRQMEEDEGISGPSPRRFSGYKPESEPETKALADYCRKENVRIALAFHSQGEEIYWNYGKRTPERSQRIGKLFAASSGYTLAEPEGLASHGGFKDWFIEEFERPAFTVEVGSGKNPLDPKCLYDIYEKLEELFLLSVIL